MRGARRDVRHGRWRRARSRAGDGPFGRALLRTTEGLRRAGSSFADRTTMKNLSRVPLGLSFFALAITLGTTAQADLSPPNVESCPKLPVGARCFERGVVPGHCVQDPEEYGGPGPKRCRVDAQPSASALSNTPTASSSASPPAPSVSGGVLPPPPAGSAPSMCAVGFDVGSGAPMGFGAMGVLIAVAMRRVRATRRSHGFNP